MPIDKEKKKALSAKRYLEQREKILADTYRWRSANLDKVRLAERERYRKNREEYLAKKAEWRLNNRDKTREACSRWSKKNPDKVKDKSLRRRYGMTLDTYRKMLATQGGICAIPDCRGDGGAAGLVVDHCHSTGIVRGLICKLCNAAIGMFKDAPDTMRGAALYVERATPARIMEAFTYPC